MQSLCSVEACEKPVKARGMCASHLEKWRRYGDPQHEPPRTRRLRERIESGGKTCGRCKRRKPFAEFYSDATRADGYRDTCKQCSREVARSWSKNNPERVREKSRRRRARMTDAERAKARAHNAEWKRKNPEKVREYCQRRRAAKRGVESSPVDVNRLWESTDGRCGICRGGVDRNLVWPDPRSASIDHIVPLSKGGAHSQANTQWTHLVCNLNKADRLGNCLDDTKSLEEK